MESGVLAEFYSYAGQASLASVWGKLTTLMSATSSTIRDGVSWGHNLRDSTPHSGTLGGARSY
jgi:hypothetical protein